MNTVFFYIAIIVVISAIILLVFVFNKFKHMRTKLRECERGIAGILSKNSHSLTQPGEHAGANIEQLLQSLSSGLHSLSNGLDYAQNTLSEILHAIHDGIFIIDHTGKVILVNRIAEELFDISAGSITGQSFIAAARDHEIDAVVKRCKESGTSQVNTVFIERTGLSFTVNASPVKHGVLLVIQDITDLRRLENVRKEFISNISHELRTPIASLKAILETLRDGAIDDKAVAYRFLSKSEIEIDKLAEMVSELGELSTIESRGILLHFELVDPAVICREVSERLTAQAAKRHIHMAVHSPSNVPVVSCDRKRLEQVLLNLIHNAIKFTPDDGEIEISAKLENQSVVISVADNGIGIPADDLPHVFERFYKVDKARTGGGTGLGLAIAKHLVFAHGGMIWAESVEGKGSKFSFTIPAVMQHKKAEKASVKVTI